MTNTRNNLFIYATVLLFFISCGTVKKPYYDDDAMDWKSEKLTSGNNLIHSLYLLGDTGELDDTIRNKNFVLDAASDMLKAETVETSLVYLGDNIYPHGMPKHKDPDRDMGERIINAYLALADSHDGKTYFIPGNHDWNKHKKGGRKAIKRQEEYIENYFGAEDKKVKFYPSNACGDPKVVKINKDLVYVFMDSQWWMHDWSKEKKMNHKCEIKSRGDLLKRMEEIIADHKNDEIVVMLHHPIMSNGKHGGNYNLKHHIFPLTEVNSKLWIPLPIIGSLYPIFRNTTGSIQDITHVKNAELMEGLQSIASKWKVDIIFASGHDHGLQYFDDVDRKYIVSGGGSRHDFTKQGGEASYARDARGFAKINFYENREAWLEMYTVADFGEEPILEYRTQLREPRAGTIEEEVKYPPITDKTITLPANRDFAAGPIKELFLGAQYRDIWATDVTVEVIDLETKLGGLTPIKKGGGMASNSLRMERSNGQQYILRSIKKDYTKLVDPEFGNLKVINVMADQNSASHPYNALVIPELSKAAGVFYSDPKLVYLKHQSGLKDYNSQFSEELYLLEERPSGDWSDASQFGNSSDIIGYADLLDILVDKKNHFVDQEWVLKSRIFDLFIHDWDRHDDQWRWARFEEDDKNIYRPIPRDRDQAMYKFKGILPWYIATFITKKFKGISEDPKDVKNLSFNAKHFDRYFLHDLEWSEWEAIISQMQEDITDADIDAAMKNFPPEIHDLKDTKDLNRILKARRNNLMKIGKRLYDFLNEEVEISATNDKDLFEIDQHKDGRVSVAWSVEKDKDQLPKYSRTFYPNETKEIRLYGLRGKDKFVINGEYNNAIRLRIIGGEDDDEIENNITGRKVYAYDDLEGMELSKHVVDKRSDELYVNEYDRHAFTYDTNFPIATFGNSVDDGWWLGGAISWITHGWRRDPYKSKQKISLSVAPGSQDAVRASYTGHFTDRIGDLDMAPSVIVDFPYYENYFGLGGNSINELREVEYNWVRMQSIDVNPLLRYNVGNSSQLDFGPVLQYRNITSTDGRISGEDTGFFTDDALDSRQYLGLQLDYSIGFVDNNVFPANGFKFNASSSYLSELSKSESVTEIGLNSQFYIQLLTRPKLVLANNLGYRRSFGDQQFYHHPGIGNGMGLRGYRNERFRGDAVFYHNIDLRLRLLEWDNTILPMDIGIVGGLDHGKIYYSDNEPNPWRSSQTVGVWMEFLSMMVLQPYYSFNDEEDMFTLQLGFYF